MSSSKVIGEDEASTSLPPQEVTISLEPSATEADPSSPNNTSESELMRGDAPRRKGDFKISEFKFYVACSLMVAEAIAATMLFSYVGLLVAHIEPRLTRSSAGYVAGMLVGTFQAVQVFALPVWGKLSDKLGRKPILLFASILSVAASLAFGCSTSLAMAMCFRAFHGAVAGGVATAKTLILEVTDEHSQARGFGLMNVMWAVGSFIGPSVGGFLYDINTSPIFSPFLPHIDLFDKYPALPPAIALSTYASLAAVVVAIFLPESNVNAVPFSQAVSEFKDWVTSFSGCCSKRPARIALNTNDPGTYPEEEEGEEVTREEPVTEAAPESTTTATADGEDAFNNKEEAPKSEAQMLNALIDAENARLNAESTVSYRQIFGHPLLGYVIPLYMLLCGFNIAYNEVFPLFALAYRKDGGLGFTSTQVGVSGMINALVSVCANSIFSKISSRLEVTKFWALCNVVITVSMVLIGLLSYLPNPTLCLIVFAPLCVLRTSATTWAFSINMIFTANAAPKKHLGLINTVSMSSAAAVRSIVPMIAAPIFAWSISGGNAHWFPFNHFLLFLMCGATSLLCMHIGNKIPESAISIRRA